MHGRSTCLLVVGLLVFTLGQLLAGDETNLGGAVPVPSRQGPRGDRVDEMVHFPIAEGETPPEYLLFEKEWEGLTDSTMQPRLFPNPFEEQGTTISMSLPQSGRLTAAVYNAQGELVQRLVQSEPVGAGGYSLMWDGKDQFGHSVGAGTFLCRISTDDIGCVVKITKSR